MEARSGTTSEGANAGQNLGEGGNPCVRAGGGRGIVPVAVAVGGVGDFLASHHAIAKNFFWATFDANALTATVVFASPELGVAPNSEPHHACTRTAP